MSWVAERSLTLVMLGLFAICLAGQIVAGWYEFNEEQIEHGAQLSPSCRICASDIHGKHSSRIGRASSCR